MPELRQDPMTREWVVIATERAKRPDAFQGQGEKRRSVSLGSQREKCPFCEGNESTTPPEIVAYRKAGAAANTPGWWVRVVPNLYPSLKTEGNCERRQIDNFFRMMDGVGAHEVIIESPEHSDTIGAIDDRMAEEIVMMYLDRFLDLKKDRRFENITCFRNRGGLAGASLLHPHSQIIATPMVPGLLRRRLEMAFRYYDDHGKCVYCAMIETELAEGKRVVMANEEFVVFEPFASRVPFETWIVPKEHCSAFEAIPRAHGKALGRTLNAALGLLHRKLNDPDYNYVVRTEPLREDHSSYFHWSVHILPRLTTAAGFEMGSGMYINPMPPETAAEFLRS
ncbi:galactose-1-phosphate uridylyltransferase [Candidatus Sumerlaeota bacterium]|nr:galactose-1-phosphate uridylyltransferase [Candidatus Sumerlaeota bacterium]